MELVIQYINNIIEYNMKVLGKGAFIEMSAADRGVIDEIILALNTLGEEKIISYDKEINWLNELKKL